MAAISNSEMARSCARIDWTTKTFVPYVQLHKAFDNPKKRMENKNHITRTDIDKVGKYTRYRIGLKFQNLKCPVHALELIGQRQCA
jgi:hypothetical protein